MHKLIILLLLVSRFALTADVLDIKTVPTDLTVPPIAEGDPAPGKRVFQFLPKHAETTLRHSVYLPADWTPGKTYPVLVEYAGNGDNVANGKPCLGYGISGGKGFIWVCLPFVSKDHRSEMTQWWGDVDATAAYCKEVVRTICKEKGGDPHAVFLCGFSRGAIACNVIGLHDDEIAALWRGFICHSHYDDGRWQGTNAADALKRLQRLGKKPQFISNEIPVIKKEKIDQYLKRTAPEGKFTFVSLPFESHTCNWVLCDIPERKVLRDWVADLIKK